MPGLVLRVLVLLLAVLLQAGGWSSGAYSSASSAIDREKPARLEPASVRAADNDASHNGVKSSGTGNNGAGGCDALEDSSEELSAVDDSSGGDVLPASVPNWCSPLAGGRGYAWVQGLAPGGPPADTPFKPPRV